MRPRMAVAGLKMENCNFPVLGVPKRGGGGGYHGIRDGCPQLSYILRFGRPDPTDGKLRNTGISGHFGPGWPLALREILGAG